MRLAILKCEAATEDEFIGFWSEHYAYDADREDRPYEENMGKPMTEDGALALFTWKNGSKLSKAKRKSIQSNLLNDPDPLPEPSDQEALTKYRIQPGGVIFRVFWLHCNRPTGFPIYDQHVHRAMAHLLGWRDAEIPQTHQTKNRAHCYVQSYMPFFQQFAHADQRRVDRALWAYGKFVKAYPRIAVQNT